VEKGGLLGNWGNHSSGWGENAAHLKRPSWLIGHDEGGRNRGAKKKKGNVEHYSGSDHTS